MAERILRGDHWGTIFANVLNRGRSLEQEASRLGMEANDLIAIGNKKFSNSKKWEECKRTSKKRCKKKHL